MDENPKASDLESLIVAQTKELWAFKDDLKMHVTTGELKEMLKANEQHSTGSEFGLRDHREVLQVQFFMVNMSIRKCTS